MKKISAARWLSFLLLPVSITALPQGELVTQGGAEFHLDGSSYSITAADKTIITYDSFNVAKQEAVRFIQPSKEATLLNRVVGSNSSQIFGNISSNGKVFLVNPHGVYFGKDATVDTGSLVVSTLDILDQDFLEDRFSFRSKEGFLPSFIHNEGTLIASDGIIGLIAPQVKNEGVVRANLNKVLLAGAEAVTLTFSSDGLMSFEIEDGVTDGLIEHFGNIEANEVFIHLANAKETIQNVINLDGLIDGNTLTYEHGKVRIAHQSKILANNAFIEGAKVSVEGEIDVSSETIGGTLHILGDNLELLGAQIDASGDMGGGTVLIGGEYKGEGDIRTALTNSMDENSMIKANALTNGNGGRVILWADDTTFFNGKIFAQGGSLSGDGGFVETSGKENLSVATGHVNALAPFGKAGDWLLDPTTITVTAGGGATLAQAADCTNVTTGVSISGATINAAVANVILCASTSITVNANINFANTSIGITFQGTGSTIATSLGGNVTTRGGAIAFTSTTVSLGVATVLLDTTGPAGVVPAGANITFDSTATIDGANTLSLKGGTGGTISFGAAIGATTAVADLNVQNALLVQIGANITLSGATDLTIPAPVALTGSSTITSSNKNIMFNDTINGSNSLTLTAGSGTITLANNVGPTTPLSNLAFTGTTGAITLNGNIATGNSTLTFPSDVILTHAVGIDVSSSNGNITFNSTVNGAFDLILAAGTGTVTFSGAVGGTTALTNILFTSTNLVQIGANITVGGTVILPLQFPPVSLTSSSSITSTTTNGNIIFSNTIDASSAGAQNLTLTASSGAVTFSGIIGGSTRLGSLTISSTAGSSSVSLSNNITANSFTVTNAVPTDLTASLTIDTSASNGNISFGGTVNGGFDLNLTAGTGTVTLSGAVGGTTALTNLIFTSSTAIQVGSSITVTGANPLTFAQAVVMTGTSTVTSNNANVNFNSTLDGANALTIAGGSGTTAFTGAIGGTTALSSLSVTSATITQSSTASITNALSYTGSTAINVQGNITTHGATIGLTGPVILANSPTLDTTAGGTSPTGGNISFSSTLEGTSAGSQALTLNAGSSGALTFTGSVGGTTRLGAILISSSAGTSTVSIGANVTANSFTITNAVPAILAGSSTINTSTNNGAISFGGTLDATSAGAQALTLNAGTNGIITFTGAVGATTRLGALLVSSASAGTGSVHIDANITANSFTITNSVPTVLGSTVTIDTSTNNGAISFGGTLDGSQTLTLTAGTGNITFSGAIGGTTSLTSLSASGSAITQSSSLSTTGAVAYTNTGLLTIGGALTTGAVTQTGGGTVLLEANIDSTNTLHFADSVSFNTTISLSAIGIGGILFVNPIIPTVDSAYDLTFTVTGGGITAPQLGSPTNYINTLTVTAQAINVPPFLIYAHTIHTNTSSVISGNITSPGGHLIFSAPTTVASGTFTIDVTGGVSPGSILFSSTLDGSGGLTFDVGTGNLTFSAAIGSIVPFGALTIDSANNVSLAAGFTGASFTQIEGSGTTTITGTLTTSTSTGVSIAAPIVLASSVTINTSTGSGNISLSDTVNGAENLFFIAGSGTVFLGGAVGGITPLTNLIFTSAGLIEIGSNITVTGANPLEFPYPVRISSPSIVTSNNANITFESTLDGGVDPTIDAGTGNVIFLGPIGSIAALPNLTVIANIISQNGPLTSSGAVTYINSGLATIAGMISADSFTQSGSGSVLLEADISTGSFINLTSTIDFNGSLSLVAGGSGGIIFDSPIIPTSTRIYNLTLSAKNGSIIGPQLGSPTAYINRLVMSAKFINVPLIYANSILEVIPTVFNPYFEYIPGIYTNYWKEKDTLSSPWYFDAGLITDQMVTPWKGSIWAL